MNWLLLQAYKTLVQEKERSPGRQHVVLASLARSLQVGKAASPDEGVGTGTTWYETYRYHRDRALEHYAAGLR